MNTTLTRTEKLHKLCSVQHHTLLLDRINSHHARGNHRAMSLAALNRYKNWGKSTKLDEPPRWTDEIIDALYQETYSR